MQTKILNASNLSNCRCKGNNYNVFFLENFQEVHNIKKNDFILGYGTNTLFHYPQKSKIFSLKKLDAVSIKDNKILAEAGISLPKLIEIAKKNNLGGLEFTYPIPASLGGAIYQNFGAFDCSISDLILQVNCFNIKENQLITLSKSDCNFSYRKSIFQNNNLVILSATLEFNKTIQKDIDTNLNFYKEQRKIKYSLAYTLGSIFKNPHSQPAGKLIDECGLKGLQYKSLKISNTHANIIICNKNSTTSDFIELIELIKKEVKLKKNVDLELEIAIY